VESTLKQVSDNIQVSLQAYDGASSNLAFTSYCFPVDGMQNPRSAIELRQFTYICELSVERLRPRDGAFPFSGIVPSVLSV